MDKKPALQAEGLSFSYGRKKVFSEISFSVEKGSCAAVLGKNGCGKSTLLSVLAGCKRPSGGRILLDGVPLPKSAAAARSIGYVPQENPFVEELTGRDNLRLRWLGPSSGFDRALRLPALTLLETERLLKLPVRKMSGGMKKRLSLACALLNSPSLLLLDEPGGALDLPVKNEIRRYLKAYLDSGGTVLLSTHDEADLSLCGALFFLKDARLSPVPSGLRGEALEQLFS